MKKRITSFFLSVCAFVMVFGAVGVATTVFAAEDTTITFEKVYGKVGDVVEVPVTIRGNIGLAAYRFQVAYDTSALTFLSAENGAGFSEGSINSNNFPDDGVMIFNWVMPQGVSADGTMALLRFRVEASARGEYTLKVQYNPEDILNEEIKPIDFVMQDGSISVGSAIRGNITSFGSTEDEVTIALYEGEQMLDSVVTKEKQYQLSSVAPGNYRLTVSKKNHVTRTYEIEMKTMDMTQDVKIHLIGDINGDGKATGLDYTRILRHVKEIAVLTGYEYDCADTNQSGSITGADYVRVLRHVKEQAFLWE